jgi:phage repressor protein C with HTH and peptisase S24 domain
MSIGRRVQELRKLRGMTQKQLALAVGVTQQAIAELESGRAIEPKRPVQLAKALGVDPDELSLAGSKKPLPARIAETSWLETIRGLEYAVLPSYAITASAGHGAFAQEGEPDSYQVLPQQWLKSVTRARLNDLCVIQVAGDSMWETLHNGDHVLVDRSRRTVARPGIYVLDDQGELIVKRVQKDLQTGHIDVISDNPKYPKMTVTEEGRLTVVGRVVWIGRALG